MKPHTYILEIRLNKYQKSSLMTKRDYVGVDNISYSDQNCFPGEYVLQ